MLAPLLLATNALTFALQESSIPGKVVLVVLLLASVFSWAVMVTKIRELNTAAKQNEAFLSHFRADREPLRLYRDGASFDGAPAFNIYMAGCDEVVFQLLGSVEMDETFSARLEMAPKITPVQHHAVEAAMERAVGDEALRLESRTILLATAVSGAPFLGLLGTVWGVMDTFTGVAIAGAPNLAAMAPGVSGALITTVVALLVAIPAMFGYNYIASSIRSQVVRMENFAAELASEFEHKYVSHGPRLAERVAAFR